MPLQLRCLLCSNWIEVEEESLLAKRAREQGPAFVFICSACDRRVVEKYGRRGEGPNPALGGDRPFRRVPS